MCYVCRKTPEGKALWEAYDSAQTAALKLSGQEVSSDIKLQARAANTEAGRKAREFHDNLITQNIGNAIRDGAKPVVFICRRK
jgi:hypothetical protein